MSLLDTTTQSIQMNENKSFIHLHTIFNQYDWNSIINNNNHLSYTKIGYEINVFDIQIDKNKFSN